MVESASYPTIVRYRPFKDKVRAPSDVAVPELLNFLPDDGLTGPVKLFKVLPSDCFITRALTLQPPLSMVDEPLPTVLSTIFPGAIWPNTPEVKANKQSNKLALNKLVIEKTGLFIIYSKGL